MGISSSAHFWALATLLLLVAPAHAADTPPDATAQEFLDTHNAFRTKRNLPPVEWNTKVAAFAASYAKQRKADCLLEHSDDTNYGENIFQGDGTEWTPANAMVAWADDEEKNYDVASNTCKGGECGHYTQVMWRDTTTIGCARVVCDKDGGIFMTCNYNPPGNYVGQRPF